MTRLSFLFLFPLLSIFCFSSLPARAEEAAKPQQSSNSETYQMLNLFGDVFERTRQNYVDKVEDKKLVENALNGMLASLDPHSGYLSEDEFRDMQVQTSGQFGGLGIEVTTEGGLVKVVTPIDDTPAAKAGIKSGDLITYIDGKPVLGLSLQDAVDKMRGKVGSIIELTIRREGQSEALKFKLARDIIKIQSVRARAEGNVGYIRITSFSQTTAPGLEKAVADLKKQLGNKLLGYVLDLRNNPGGLLDQAISVSDDFLDKGEIVSTRGREEEDTKRDNATPGDITDGKPVVILINEGTASAAEIVAGALQDHHRAILMGEKSFGKGSVQTVMPIPGHGAMRLTTARYFTPSGRSIQAKGIEPDIEVKLAKIEELGAGDDVIHESDLKGALENPDKKPAPPPEESSQDPANGSDKSAQGKDDPAASVLSEQARKDYQLRRALDLIEGIALYQTQGPELKTPSSPAAEKPTQTPAKE